MALPGPLSALDAWDALLPTAQRMAELLDAIVPDESATPRPPGHRPHPRRTARLDRKQESGQIR